MSQDVNPFRARNLPVTYLIVARTWYVCSK